MNTQVKKNFLPFIVISFFLLFPYLMGFILFSVHGDQFGGFLLNPIDGNSYLAKMEIGHQGSWEFRLPYTSDPGEGRYLFLFYILLGHIARIIHLPNLVVFHLVRMASYILLYYVIILFLKSFSPQLLSRDGFIYLFFLGSGMGWVFLLSGYLPADYYVAEAYPFLSCYSNPHFPFGQSLMLLILIGYCKKSTFHFFLVFFSSIVLSLVIPFGLVVLGFIFVFDSFYKVFSRQNINWYGIFPFLVGGLPFSIMQYFSILNHPQLSVWNSQNITPSPPFWDLWISFSPLLLFAVLSPILIKSTFAEKHSRLLFYWIIVALFLVYIPFNLQRRFLFGYYIPVFILGAGVVMELERKHLILKGRLFSGVLVLSLINMVIIIIMGVSGILQRNSLLYVSSDEKNAFQWIEANTLEEDLILSSSETGNLIPAYTGRRVVYGHPFETIDAESQQQAVRYFFTNKLSPLQVKEFLTDYDVEYVFYGPREKSLNPNLDFDYLSLIFSSGNVQIYATKNP